MIRDNRFVRRVISAGDMGVAESYMAGEWTSPDVTSFLELFCINHDVLTQKINGAPWCGRCCASGTG